VTVIVVSVFMHFRSLRIFRTIYTVNFLSVPDFRDA
jgi:hypothetical protein